MTLIITGGQKPPFSIFQDFVKNKSTIICADSGFDYAYENGILPSIAIGDFDSIQNKDKLYQTVDEKNIFEFVKDKDLSDTALCLEYCIEKNLKDIILFGSNGDRADHFLNTYYDIARFNIPITWLTQTQIFLGINSKTTIKTKINQTVSIFCPTLDAKISHCTGLKWNIKDINWNNTQSLSNIATSNVIEIDTKGYIFLIMDIECYVLNI